MKFTGHSDYKSMKPYIDITEDAKRDAISLMEMAFDAKFRVKSLEKRNLCIQKQ